MGRWRVGDAIYQEPDLARSVAENLAREHGEALGISQTMLDKRLNEGNWLVTTDKTRGTATVRKQVEHNRREVLHHRAQDVLEGLSPSQNTDQSDHSPVSAMAVPPLWRRSKTQACKGRPALLFRTQSTTNPVVSMVSKKEGGVKDDEVDEGVRI